jgi:hypothetical protein
MLRRVSGRKKMMAMMTSDERIRRKIKMDLPGRLVNM